MNIGNMAKGMNDVTRYDVIGRDPVEPYEDGEYVRYTDYAALQQQLAAAREELSAASDLLAHRFEQLQAAEADAARYRWLMQHGRSFTVIYPVFGTGSKSFDTWPHDEKPNVTDAIDAEIATLQRDRQP